MTQDDIHPDPSVPPRLPVGPHFVSRTLKMSVAASTSTFAGKALAQKAVVKSSKASTVVRASANKVRRENRVTDREPIAPR